jgi:hypothetical protein
MLLAISAAAVGTTYSFISITVVEGQRIETGRIAGDVVPGGGSDFLDLIAGEDGDPQEGFTYVKRIAASNTGTVGAHMRAYVSCVWEDGSGTQVALPDGLVAVDSITDCEAGWTWIKSPEGYWDRERAAPDAEGGSALPAGSTAEFDVELLVAGLPPQAAGKNVKVKVSVELIGEMVYRLLY